MHDARPVEILRLKSFPIRRNSDVAMARDRTRAAAEALGLAPDDVTRIATAAAEIARAIVEQGCGELVLSAVVGARSGLRLKFRTEHRLIARPDVSWDPVRAAQSLTDRFDLREDGRAQTLRLVNWAPPDIDVGARVAGAAAALEAAEADESTSAIRMQNRELARLLDEVRRRGRELERMNDELQNANNQATAMMLQLVELSRRKDELAAAVAHDLRSPLAAVKGALDLLAGGMAGHLSPEQQRVIDIAERASRHILQLVNDLVESSLIDAGMARLDRDFHDLPSIVEEVGATVGFLAREKGIAYEVCLPPGIPPVWVDRHKLGQVLSNLLTNAVKFTHPGGSVRVSAEALGDAVAVEVADTGVGIPPEQVARLFDKFRRTHSRGTQGERGTGLGLYICRQLVELHGGTIGVRSTPGAGTTVRFTTPCRSGVARTAP